MNTKKDSKEKTFNITNFIAVYDNYITKEECNNAIQLFENETKFNRTVNRSVFEGAKLTQKQDLQFFANANNIDTWWEDVKGLKLNYEIALKHYLDNTGAGDHYGELSYTTFKIQKTLPTEGYHTWHIEHMPGFHYSSRALVFTIYLNDVEEGGETEFLHQSVRVKPKTGRIVIWPAGFPYVHRGNPPLSGEKYILTSWMLLDQ